MQRVPVAELAILLYFKLPRLRLLVLGLRVISVFAVLA
jgi:hypothetical protein